MAFTPGARAYGRLDDYFSGAINAIGCTIEPFTFYKWTFGKKCVVLGDSQCCPGFVLNAYAPEVAAADDFSQVLFDVVWTSSQPGLQDEGIAVTTALRNDFDTCPAGRVLVVNQWDTLTMDRCVGSARPIWEPGLADTGPEFFTFLGVVSVAKTRTGFTVVDYWRGKPSWEALMDMMPDEVKERLSPAASTVPLSNSFEMQPTFPSIPWEMGPFLTHPDSELDTSLRSGGGKALRFIFEYSSQTGEPCFGWVSEPKALHLDFVPSYHCWQPHVLA